RDAHPLALPIGGELVAQRPAAEEKESDGGDGDREALHDFSLTPSSRPLFTTHSCALHEPTMTATDLPDASRARGCFVEKSIAARGAIRTPRSSSRRISTRAERPGRIIDGSILASLTTTRNFRRIDSRASSCATAA